MADKQTLTLVFRDGSEHTVDADNKRELNRLFQFGWKVKKADKAESPEKPENQAHHRQNHHQGTADKAQEDNK